jgi:hypothetical protein
MYSVKHIHHHLGSKDRTDSPSLGSQMRTGDTLSSPMCSVMLATYSRTTHLANLTLGELLSWQQVVTLTANNVSHREVIRQAGSAVETKYVLVEP